MSGTQAPRAWGPRLRVAIGWPIALAGLVWVLHDVRPAGLAATFVRVKWAWVIVALLLDVMSYAAQGLRWRLLLWPSGLSPLRATQAVYAGLFTNEIMPLRLGELVRTWLVARWTGRDFASVLASIGVERLFDGLWLVLMIGISATIVPLPRGLLTAADVIGGVVIAGALLFVWRAWRRHPVSRSPRALVGGGVPGIVRRFIARLDSGARSMAFSGTFFAALVASSLILILQMGSFWLLMPAFGISLSPVAGAVVFLIVHVGTALPNAPSNVGTYQLFSVIGLQLFGVDKTLAAAFSIGAFLLLTMPLWLIGFVALARSGATLATIRADLARRSDRADVRAGEGPDTGSWRCRT